MPADDLAHSPFGDGVGAHAEPGGSTLAAGRAESARQRVADLLQHGSLRGTTPDGDWGLWVGTALQPSLSLRRRFDYLLTGIGEVEASDLRQWIADEVGALHGAEGARQVIAVWDRYLALLQTREDTGFDIGNAESWQRALAQRTARRQAAMGPAWALAFFAEEDRDTAAFIARRFQPAQPAPGDAANATDPYVLMAPASAPLTDAQAKQREAQRLAAFGAEGAERLKVEDAAWQAWEQRIATAKQGLAAIANDPQLSPPQRQQAQQDALAQQFSGNELMRARALLGVRP